MTDLLERAIARLQTLPESEQDAIASIILEEIERFVRQSLPSAQRGREG
jgi:hypothetical protein